MQKPKPTHGLRHVALNVINLEASIDFYTKLLDLKIEWQPDPDNYYLTSGHDNLALHRAKPGSQFDGAQRLDHIGFILNEFSEVDIWCEYLRSNNVVIKAEPKTHRDGARSFYCLDPDGNLVQMICLGSVEK